MNVTVKLFATLREYGDKIQAMEFPDGMVPEEIIKVLNIPTEEVAIIMINGRGSKLDTPIKEGDVIALFPPVGGG